MKQIVKVHIINRQKKVNVPVGLRLVMRRVCHAVLRSENFEGSAEISIIFVDNDQIRELNQRYRGKDVATDMLSFPSTLDNGEYETNSETGAKILGDIILSIEKAYDESKEEGSPMEGKLLYWTAHSLLHLLGYDHEKSREDEVFMRDRSECIMELIGYPHWNCRS